MSVDRNFDDLTSRFRNNIYGTTKGTIRLAILNDDLQVAIPELNKKSLSILDVGAGQGHMALQLAQAGHSLVLCDVSAEMLEEAKQRFAQHEITIPAGFVLSSVQELARHIGNEEFDLVMCHAVLEWVGDQQHVLQELSGYIKPGGYLSLMFYNRHSAVLRNLLRGNFRKVESDDYTGHKTSLTPTYPIEPETVYNWLNESGLQIKSKSGVRTFYDYLSKELREQRSDEDILSLERRFSREEPYLSMARYIHVIAQRIE